MTDSVRQLGSTEPAELTVNMKKGADFKDYLCPDGFENDGDYFMIGGRYGRVLLLRDYASYIKDSMVAELTDVNRNMMLSIDVVPVPTDEAVREVESRLLGVETNITNWQRRQNMVCRSMRIYQKRYHP